MDVHLRFGVNCVQKQLKINSAETRSADGLNYPNLQNLAGYSEVRQIPFKPRGVEGNYEIPCTRIPFDAIEIGSHEFRSV